MKIDELIVGDRTASLCGLVCLLGLGGFLLWAGTVPLAEGVAVPGQIVVEDNRKRVQHLEGGIVRRLFVTEGSEVRRGQRLLELEDVQARSDREQVAQAVAALRGALDRLQALSEQRELRFRSTEDLGVSEALVAEIRDRETALFRQQQEALSANVSVLGARGSSLHTDAAGKARQIAAIQDSLALVRRQLAERRQLLAERLIRRDSVDELQQEEGRLSAELARLQADRGSSLGQAGEVRTQVAKAHADFRQEIAAQLRETRNELSNAEERLRAANDVLARTVIYAPQSGKVLNLRFATIGGVVRPGEDIMEIVPDSVTLVARVSVRPNQRDAVAVGLPVTARLNINRSWAAPEMTGTVVDISGDLKTVPETGDTFYEARVHLRPPPELTQQFEVLPGMPVEARINSGVERTFLSYLVEPIQSVINRGL